MSEKNPGRLVPGQIPTDMQAFNRALIDEFRAGGGKLSGPMAAAQLMLLTTKGARTGLERTAVLGYRRSGDTYVAIASNNGAPSTPAWYHNLLAHPDATVEVGANRIAVHAHTAVGSERDRLAALVDYLERQQQLTGRQIPVVALEPIKS